MLIGMNAGRKSGEVQRIPATAEGQIAWPNERMYGATLCRDDFDNHQHPDEVQWENL
jgi:hypothetical protein